MRICSLASGSSGNATYVATETSAILVDCGATARDVIARLHAIGVHPFQLSGILISHAHIDHYRSAGTLHARFGIPVYVDPSTARALASRSSHGSWRRVREKLPLPERIGDIEIEAVDTSHGHPGRDGRTVAFVLRKGRRKVGIVTDLGIPSRRLIQSLRGADVLVLEANYDDATVRSKLSDPRYRQEWNHLDWVAGSMGHLSNGQCARVLAEVIDSPDRHVFLGHVSENHVNPRQDNNDTRLALGAIRRFLARETGFLPRLHRTYRIGRDPGRPSEMVEA